jgi:hypothetical protein
VARPAPTGCRSSSLLDSVYESGNVIGGRKTMRLEHRSIRWCGLPDTLVPASYRGLEFAIDTRASARVVLDELH